MNFRLTWFAIAFRKYILPYYLENWCISNVILGIFETELLPLRIYISYGRCIPIPIDANKKSSTNEIFLFVCDQISWISNTLVLRAYTVLPQHVYCGCNTILISKSSLNVICDVISSITFQYMRILLCDTSAWYIFNIGKW